MDTREPGPQSGSADPSIAGSSRRLGGVVELIGAMILSGTIGMFVVESGAEPATAAWFRCVIGAAVMGGYCWVRGYFRSSGYTQRLVLLAGAGGVALVANWVLLFAAYTNTSIGIATVAYHVQPFLLILAAPLLFGERITWRQGGWVAVGFAGLVLIAQPWRESLTGGFLFGILQAVAAAVLYAAATLIAKRINGVRPHVTVAIQTSVGAVLLIPAVSWSATGDVWGLGWTWLLGLGVIHTGIMYLLMYSAYPKLATPVIAVIGFVYPVAALLVDLLVYDTALSVAQMVGVVAILTAGVVITRPRPLPAAPQTVACSGSLSPEPTDGSQPRA